MAAKQFTSIKYALNNLLFTVMLPFQPIFAWNLCHQAEGDAKIKGP